MEPVGRTWKATESVSLRRVKGLLFVLVLAMVTGLPVKGQPAGDTSEIPDFDPVACGCSDIPPPGSPLTCEEQRDFGKCSAKWMLTPAPEAGFTASYCQITCGRCECHGAPALVEEGPCACSDVPIPGDLYNCKEQLEFGKCYRPWMRRSSAALPDGYCQITCGLCPCADPIIIEIPSPPGLYSSPAFKTETELDTDSKIESRPSLEDPGLTALLEEPVTVVHRFTPNGGTEQPTKLPPPPPPVAGDLGKELDEQRIEVENADDAGNFLPPFDEGSTGGGRLGKPQRRLQEGLDQFLTRWNPAGTASKGSFGAGEETGGGAGQDSQSHLVTAFSETTKTQSEVPTLPVSSTGSVQEPSTVQGTSSFQNFSPAPEPAACSSTIGDLLDSPIGRSQFKIVSQLIAKSGLLEDLNSPTLNSTLFVPKDTAFDHLREDVDLDRLLNENSTSVTNFIKKVVLLHLVDGVITTDQFEEDKTMQSLLASAVDSQGTGESGIGILKLKFSEAKDAWFVRSGKRRARVDLSDVDLCGSVVHVVNNVLLPPEDPSSTFIPQEKDAASCDAIVGFFNGPVSGGRFSILLALLERTDLIEEIRNPGLVTTVFAPTDDAFRSIPDPFCIDRLLTDSSPRGLNEIQKLLLFHVVPRRLERSELTDGLRIGTFLDSLGFENGKADLVISHTRESGIEVLGADTKAAIIGPPIEVCNSVVHMIDAVMVPTFNENLVELMLCHPDLPDDATVQSAEVVPDPWDTQPSPNPDAAQEVSAELVPDPWDTQPSPDPDAAEEVSAETESNEPPESPVVEAASETQGPVFGTINFATITG